MSDSDSSDKTEEPSGKRLADARTRGQVLQSRDVSNLIMIGAASIVVLVLGPMLANRVLLLCRAFFEKPHLLALDSENFRQLMTELLMTLAFAMLVPLVVLMLAALATGVLQFGLLFAPDALAPNLNKINPIAGFKRLFSLRSVSELIKSMIKLGLITIVAVALLGPAIYSVEDYVSTDISEMLTLLRALTARFLVGVIILLIILAILDYLYQRFEFMKRMRMSKQELKDEFKQMDGDPIIKARLRKLRQDRARRRMMANVPTATVVVTNPTHYAVALQYDRNMTAPKMVAKGMDLVALRIRDLARDNGVPIVENPPLARTLHAMVELDQDIHPDHYKAVAEVISYVMRLKASAVGAPVPAN